MAQTTRITILRARQLRQHMSLPEVMLWQILRKKPLGIKFRRQHPFGSYILDFYCASAKLAIEIDGQSHDMGDRPERDVRRDMFLRQRGIAVVRIAASDILDDVEDIADQIVRYVEGSK